MDKVQIKKWGRVLASVLLCLFLLASLFLVFLTLFSKRDADGAARIFGHEMRVVTSDSMAESAYTDTSAYDIGAIPVGSMIWIETVPGDAERAEAWYRSLRVGDVLTFRYVYNTQVTITHRIVSVTEKETGGFLIELEGDNKSGKHGALTQTIDTSLADSPNYVIGRVVGKSLFIGKAVSLLMTRAGIVFLIILPCLFILLFEVLRIIKMLNDEKRKREEVTAAAREKELCELREKLALLEKKSAVCGVATESEADSLEKTESKEDMR